MAHEADNSDIEGKIMVRHEAVRLIGGQPKVLDLFAGEGSMYRLVWKDAATQYLGCDKRFARGPDSPQGHCLRGDNAVLLGRMMARAPWDTFDLDAYANPWPLLRAVLHRAAPQRIVVTATCTLSRAIKLGSGDFAIALVRHYPKVRYCGLLVRWYDSIIQWALEWALGGSPYRIADCKRTRSDGSPQTYYYVIMFERP